MKNLYKAQRLALQLANGLDSILESKDRQRQAKQTRESKKSQQNKRHNTDITSSHTESKQKDSTHSIPKATDVKNTQSHTLDSKNNTKESKKQNNTEQQSLDSLLTLKLINGGYKEKYWGFGEEVEEEIEEKIDISQGILIASNDDRIAFELLATNPKHQFNCPDVESGSFIQNLRGFSGMLDFLENAIYNTKATLDYDNLKEYESYNTAEYKSDNIYAKNKCLSERIKAIYTKDWLFTLSKDTQEAYIGDIHIFMGQWRETLQEKHQNIQSFVASFCKKTECIGLKTKYINSMDNEMNILIANAMIEIRSYNAVSLHNQRVQDRLLFLLRQWYIVSRSQHNSFDVLLRKYMRYIEINIRYFYVYDESDKYFYTQICINDLKRLREVM